MRPTSWIAPAGFAGRLTGRDGFTLIEALAAFAILAFLILAVQRGIVMAGAGVIRADGWIEAERVARTLLALPASELGSEPGRRTGQSEGRNWTLTLESLPLPTARQEREDEAPIAWAPMRVIVSVSVGGAQTFDVETVRVVRIAAP